MPVSNYSASSFSPADVGRAARPRAPTPPCNADARSSIAKARRSRGRSRLRRQSDGAGALGARGRPALPTPSHSHAAGGGAPCFGLPTSAWGKQYCLLLAAVLLAVRTPNGHRGAACACCARSRMRPPTSWRRWPPATTPILVTVRSTACANDSRSARARLPRRAAFGGARSPNTSGSAARIVRASECAAR
ncbi:MAG: hypothetical protein QOF19_3393 [Alphaproteobacteria bacterium]|nr:hypothetical protein [Alphaproteobacteria bacterium]